MKINRRTKQLSSINQKISLLIGDWCAVADCYWISLGLGVQSIIKLEDKNDPPSSVWKLVVKFT